VNTFYTHLQPNIVKFSDDEEIPESLRCHYAINYNVWGIDYFYANYILQESDDGAYLIVNENGIGNILLEDSLSETDIIDIPRLYIMITDEFIHGDSKFQQFIYEANKNNSVYSTGIDGFRPGTDYWLNTTLFNYLANNNQVVYNQADDEYDPLAFKLPNYLDYDGSITKYFVDLSNEPIRDYTNLEYFDKKNMLLENVFTEEELKSFCQTFFNTISGETKISQEMMYKVKNQIYSIVINYFSNSMSDDTSIALQLVLGTQYGTVTKTTQSCGCTQQQQGSTTTTVDQSCASIYQQAMNEWMKAMLSDPEFYEDWFSIQLSDEERIPNDVMIEKIQTLFKEFLDLGYDLDFSPSTLRWKCSCTPTAPSSNSPAEYRKIENFLSILDWVNNCEIDENSNKIKAYGQAFAEILPLLQF